MTDCLAPSTCTWVPKFQLSCSRARFLSSLALFQTSLLLPSDNWAVVTMKAQDRDCSVSLRCAIYVIDLSNPSKPLVTDRYSVRRRHST